MDEGIPIKGTAKNFRCAKIKSTGSLSKPVDLWNIPTIWIFLFGRNWWNNFLLFFCDGRFSYTTRLEKSGY